MRYRRLSSKLEQKTVPLDVAAAAIELIRTKGLDVWVYRGNDWLVAHPDAPHVAHRTRLFTLKYETRGADYLLYSYHDLDVGQARDLVRDALKSGA